MQPGIEPRFSGSLANTLVLILNWTVIYNCLNDTKQSDSEVSVMLWGMQSTYLLPSLQGPLWQRVVAPDRILFMGQIELFGI